MASAPHQIKATFRLAATSLLSGLTLVGCAGGAPMNAKIVQSGTIECFDANSLANSDKPPSCELSAVARAGRALVFANDKPIPGKPYSPVFSISFDGGKVNPGNPREYFLQPLFVGAQKYESMATTPDGKWVFAMTAFDRYAEDKPEQDRYNDLLAWPAADPGKVALLDSGERQGVASSAGLRERFARALGSRGEGLGYFKIEGLAALPGNRLLFGVREIGKTYKDAAQTIKIIETGYQETAGGLGLQGDFSLVYEFAPALPGIPHKLGLSSLEYDNLNNRLYLLTSFEEGEKPENIGAYLWTFTLDELRANKAPTLVMGENGQPLVFSHKAEGLAILDKNRILLIHDDDRIVTQVKTGPQGETRDRRLNESAFDVLEWF